MNRAIIIIISLSLFLISSLTGCVKNRDKKDDKKEMSLLVYMASNNSLSSYAEDNIKELVDAYSEGDYANGNIVVYYRGSGAELPTLNVVDNNYSLTPIKTYENHNCADVEVMRQVIDDFKSYCGSKEYGCLFWSHGSAWLPQSFKGNVSTVTYSMLPGSETTISNQDDYENIENHPLYNLIRKVDYSPQTRAFGQDDTDWMELSDMVDAIDDNEFDYIIFDACYMSSIEVLYAFRNKADWMLGSPTEVLGAGMEYKTMASNLFSSASLKDKLIAVAESFKDRYDECTVSLINLENVEQFAQEYSELVKDIPDMLDGVTPANVQRYDRYTNHVLFDVCDYITKISPENSDKIWSMVDDIVEYRYATDYFLYINMYSFGGVSTYIPFANYSNLNGFYDQLDWSVDVLNR